MASIGAGGVLYLTPILFNSLSFTASQIGTGIAIAAVAGTITRLIAGYYLDQGMHFARLLRIAALLAITADIVLIRSNDYADFIIGEILLGSSAGIYWPSVEIAVPLSCISLKSSKGFALARSADALGVSIGTLIGSCAAYFGYIRLIYLVESLVLLVFIRLISNNLYKDDSLKSKYIVNNTIKSDSKHSSLKEILKLVYILFPLLIISLFSTGMLSLIQTALPLDLVIGGIKRRAISESSTGFIIGVKLGILLILQWPIGNWLSNKNIKYGLNISLISFSVGSLLLSLSSLYIEGIYLTLLGLISISVGLAAFLPTAAEAIIQISPKEKQGISMAIYSQCFGISAFIAPWLAGILIDINGNAYLLWLIGGLCYLSIIPFSNLIRKKKTISV